MLQYKHNTREALECLHWELEYEVRWRPRQVVYIRIKADISALTYPNKRQPLPCSCWRRSSSWRSWRRMEWKSELKETGKWPKQTETGGECPCSSVVFHLYLKRKHTKSQSKHNIGAVAFAKGLFSIPSRFLRA